MITTRTTDAARDVDDDVINVAGDVINDNAISNGTIIDDVVENKEPRYIVHRYINVIICSPIPSNEVQFVSSRGVRFASISMARGGPHDVHCVREVLKFLIAIINPQDKYVTIFSITGKCVTVTIIIIAYCMSLVHIHTVPYMGCL